MGIIVTTPDAIQRSAGLKRYSCRCPIYRGSSAGECANDQLRFKA